jgi:hypothetical protein
MEEPMDFGHVAKRPWGITVTSPATNRRVARVLLGVLLATIVGASTDTNATPPTAAQTEITYLLGFVERSGCQFYRNGSWYDSKKAQEHLLEKYNLLAASNQIGTTEDFIEKVATASSLTKQPYRVRCANQITLTTKQWLSTELTRYRSHAATVAPRALRGATGAEVRDS